MPFTGAQIIFECLQREGVDVVFGYPGGQVLSLYNAMLDYPGIHHVLARHEQGACHMADGYARASQKAGVVIATSGPGATNLVTGLATAMMDSVPLVAITGQVPAHLLGSDAFQEIDVTGVTLPITKHNFLVQRAEDIAPVLREAFAVARHGRPGPVLVDITSNAQKAITELNYDEAVPTRHLRHVPPRPAESEIQFALDLIREAKRPLILAGHGILMSGARMEVLAFAEKTGTPIATTLLGIGAIPASHPLNLGMMGMHGEAWTNQAIQEADLLLAFGMRFDDRVTGDLKTYALKAKKIHVDIDASEFQKNVQVDAPILGDLKDVLAALLARQAAKDHSEWLAHIHELRGHAQADAVLENDGSLHAPQVIHDLCQATKGQALMVSDVGQHQMWEAQYYQHEVENSLITSGGLGTMGFALPAALGARFAQPEREIWVIVGDGGFQMNVQELMTLMQEGKKLNIAILNNGFLGMVRQWQELFYQRRYSSTPMLNPNFVKLGEAFGIPGRTVSTREDVLPAIEEARKAEGPFILEFLISQEFNVFPMVPAGARLDQMLRRSEHSISIQP
jgi:acetolactate synthase-1/2/3 large subunit